MIPVAHSSGTRAGASAAGGEPSPARSVRMAAARGAVQALRVLERQVHAADPDSRAVRAAMDDLVAWTRQVGAPTRHRRLPAATDPRAGARPRGDGPLELHATPVTAAAIRAWARRRGLRVSAVGRLPSAVVRLYLADREQWHAQAGIPRDWCVWNENRVRKAGAAHAPAADTRAGRARGRSHRSWAAGDAR